MSKFVQGLRELVAEKSRASQKPSRGPLTEHLHSSKNLKSGLEELDKLAAKDDAEFQAKKKEKLLALASEERGKTGEILKPTKSDKLYCYAMRRGPKCPVLPGIICDCCLRMRVKARAKKRKLNREKAVLLGKKRKKCKDCGKRKKVLERKNKVKSIWKELRGAILKPGTSSKSNANKLLKALFTSINPGATRKPSVSSVRGKRVKLLRKRKASRESKRRPSQLVFIMPKEEELEDPELKSQLEIRKRVKKLIKYAKKFWKVEITKSPNKLPLIYRTLGQLIHAKPEDWWWQKRAREKVSDYSGFFSNVRNPYLDLGKPVLDLDELFFKTFQPELKINSARWHKVHQDKKEAKEKQEATLPSLRTRRIQKPIHIRGKIRNGIGGTREIDGFIRDAEQFQKRIRGKFGYQEIIDEWLCERDNETHLQSRNPFGMIPLRETEPGNGDGDGKQIEGIQEVAEASSPPKTKEQERIMRREIHNFENMLQALYDIIRMILNINPFQLASSVPLTEREIRALRSTVPRITPREIQPPKSISILVKKIKGLSPQFGKDEAPKDKNALTIIKGVKNLEKADDTSLASDAAENDASSNYTQRTDVNAESNPMKKSIHKSFDGTDFFPSFVKKKMEIQANTYAKVFEDSKKVNRRQWQILTERSTDNILSSNAATKILNEIKNPELKHPATGNKEIHLDLDTRIGKIGKKFLDTADIPTPSHLPSSKIDLLSENISKSIICAPLSSGSENNTRQSSALQRLYKEAGVVTTHKEIQKKLHGVKRHFWIGEEKLRFYYLNELEKSETGTVGRFLDKINALKPLAIYEHSIQRMRLARKMGKEVQKFQERSETLKRPIRWFRHLNTRFEELGGIKHQGCTLILDKIKEYCEFDVNSRKYMLSRLCLIVFSISTTELGTRHWQEACLFALTEIIGAHSDFLYLWLHERNLPALI